MATVIVTHSKISTKPPVTDPSIIGGPDWNGNHVVTGLENVPNVDTTNASNITSGTLPAARLPAPTAVTLGGVESIAAVAHNWINSISTAGTPALSQPAFSDISGTLNFPTTNLFFTQNGAAIHRLGDRLFVGAAAANDGAFPNVTQDWLSAFQTAAGLSSGSIVGAQFATLNDASGSSGAAGVFGAQTLNFTSAGTNSLAMNAFAVNNNATFGTSAWAYYGEAHRVSAAAGTTYSMELDSRTLFASQTPTPYLQGTDVVLQLAAGAGFSATGQFDVSAAIGIQPNPMKFKKGIYFGSTALTAANGIGGNGIALEMARGQTFRWSNSTPGVDAEIWGDANGFHISSGAMAVGPSGSTVTPDSLLTVNANTGSSVAPSVGTSIHVVGADAVVNVFTMDAYGGANNVVQGRMARGTLASKTAVQATDVLLNVNAQGWDTTGYFTGSRVQYRSTETWSATAHGSEVAIGTITNGTTTLADAFIVKNSGGVSIGSGTDPGVGGLALHPGSSITPVSNGDLVIQATSNTSLTFKYKGSDGVVRSASLTLA